jgi:hypothetical protein
VDPRVGYRQNRGRGDQMLLNLTEKSEERNRQQVKENLTVPGMLPS